MTPRFMLDTNAVSTFMHGRSRSLDAAISIRRQSELCISAITQGETLFGLANLPHARHLHLVATTLFEMVDVLPWTAKTASAYGKLCAGMKRCGLALQPLDMLIAAHALESVATLVTSDKAFRHVPGLVVEDWTAA